MKRPSGSVKSEETTIRLPASWSLDGRWIALVEMNRETGTDLWLLEMGEGGSSTPFLVTPFEEHSPKFSPDGRWIAYVSNESGREEVYARPFPGPGGKWALSTAGGSEPVWSSDGSELYYRSPEGMMGIPVDTNGALRAGKPRVLFDDTFQHHFLGVANYDVAPESGRFVMVEPNQESSGPAQLKVVLNWAEELERLAGGR